MKLLRNWLLAAALVFSTGLQAQQVPPQLNDFAMQLPLTVSGANGVVQLRLPLTVYQQAVRADLADLCIFNAAGQPLPFALLASANSSERVNWREVTARVFPIYGSSPTNATQAQLEISVAADGALVSVRSNERRAAGQPLAAPPSALILDAGPPNGDEVLDSVQLVRSDVATYRAELAIEVSDDLKLWDRVAQGRVDWLQGTRAESLVNDRIAVGARGARYLRIQWMEGTPLVFDRIAVRWRSVALIAAPPLEVKLQPTLGALAGDLLYAASPSIPATQVGLELATANSVLPASIGYYERLPHEAQPRFVAVAQGTFYRLTRNAEERTSSAIRIAPWSSREWVVRVGESGDAPPVLVLRWYPSTLLFTARGAGNGEAERRRFILAVGAVATQAQGALSRRTSVDRVAPGFTDAELAAAEQAVPGEWQRSGTAIAATPAPTTSWMPKRSLMLWAVLISGALVLAALTWRLYCQMQAAPPS